MASKPLSAAERGRLGGRKAQANKTPEQRKESMQRLHVQAAVARVVEAAPELTQEQIERLRAAFSSVIEEAGSR